MTYSKKIKCASKKIGSILSLIYVPKEAEYNPQKYRFFLRFKSFFLNKWSK